MTIASTAEPFGSESAKMLQEAFPEVDPANLRPSPENDTLYGEIRPTDKEVQELAVSVRDNGVMEPILTTADDWIISGHRRHTAAKMVGATTVPVRRLEKNRADYTTDEYVALIREHNRQRVKSVDQVFREAVVDADPDEAYNELLSQRQPVEPKNLFAVDMGGSIRRSGISDAKDDMVAAVVKVLKEHEEYLPINARKVHYELAQHHRPLKHKHKPDSKYLADKNSYDNLIKLLSRMRITGVIPQWAISDDTRPQTLCGVYPNADEFIHSEVEGFCKGYWRDLMRSQEVHVEICVEKNTIFNFVAAIAKKYTIPITSLRGMPSLPTKYRIAQRFKETGKDRLVLLLATDFDPTGELIAENMGKGLRDEYGIWDIRSYKIAVTPTQAKELGTAQNVEGIPLKKGDSRAAKFRHRHGKDAVAYELEALSVADLQRLTHKAIDGVLNIDLLNAERKAERADSLEIKTRRDHLMLAMGEGG